ncbi:GNAT family N-acetyltransferase [Pseudovibrio sp. Alg231-02]|uniref:GNAT family N-acetyltransferase n=1 Tax=Pseudovibrio sp. Alg231-02 TaxID=1922223 RepID=UPI000D55F0E8|nr:GNAT family protein [Pseudovibrio sp. Alg231-02]
MEFPELKTKRLTLRVLRENDLTPICDYLNNFEVTRMLSVVPYPYTKADGEWWLSNCANTPLTQEVNWAIEFEHRFIGVISIHISEEGVPLIGYWLAKPFWGKGFMSEATAEVIQYCFEVLGSERITCGAFDENHGSLRVQEKNGFQRTGLRPDKCRARGNEAVTLIETELTRHLWEAMRAVTV